MQMYTDASIGFRLDSMVSVHSSVHALSSGRD